jgi:hypothetical protein
MVIFNSYVKLPEGTLFIFVCWEAIPAMACDHLALQVHRRKAPALQAWVFVVSR